VDSNGGFFAGAGVDGGIKLIIQDNGKLSVAKGNQTLELNVGIGTSQSSSHTDGTMSFPHFRAQMRRLEIFSNDSSKQMITEISLW
jgi:hypothetical protein